MNVGEARRSAVAIFIGGLAMLLLAGCCGHFTCSHPRTALAPPAEVIREFTPPSLGDVDTVESGLEMSRHYRLARFELPGATNGSANCRPLVLDCFLPHGCTNAPVVLILPMLGGSYPLEKFFGKYFAKHGMASVLVHREDYDKTPLTAEGLNAAFHQSVLDNKRAIDWLETRPEFDVSRLGLFGVSMGAIKASLLLSLEPRIDAAVLAMPAGDLPYVLTYTTERGISRRRAEIMKERGLTEETLRATLKDAMTCDPIRFAKYVDPSKVLLVLAAWDSTVPIKKGLELRTAMGKPETIVVASGHYTALLYLPYLRYQAGSFLKKRLTREAAKHSEVSHQTKVQ